MAGDVPDQAAGRRAERDGQSDEGWGFAGLVAARAGAINGKIRYTASSAYLPNNMTDDWKSYQEDVASVFRNLGCSVETNCECVGARTKHLLDVSVRISLFGLSQHWVVECKYWKNKRVSKDKVMTLKSVVDDIGADRGILIAEAGHQSGAHEVTAHTNIMLTSLPELRASVNATLLALGFSKVRRRNLVMKEEIMSFFNQTREGNTVSARPKAGVDGAVVAEINMCLDIMKQGAEQLELGKLPVPVGFRNSVGLEANNLEEFVTSASKLLDALESTLGEQRGKASVAEKENR